MLTHTFCHLPGIGEQTEKRIWAAGLADWHQALGQQTAPLPSGVKSILSRYLEESLRQRQARNAIFFAQGLPANQRWRLYRDFQDSCAFLDIETTGLNYTDEITTIALYDGQRVRVYVNGQNLQEFVRDIQEYRLLVTYNGIQFDIPRIENFFGIRLPQAHIDLRFPLRSLGIKGGLKKCEKQLGITRSGLEDVNGYTAILLWQEYRRHQNQKALETLLAYNIQDTVGLHTLMTLVFNRKLAGTPAEAGGGLPLPAVPANLFNPDRETLIKVGGLAPDYARFDLGAGRLTW